MSTNNFQWDAGQLRRCCPMEKCIRGWLNVEKTSISGDGRDGFPMENENCLRSVLTSDPENGIPQSLPLRTRLILWGLTVLIGYSSVTHVSALFGKCGPCPSEQLTVSTSTISANILARCWTGQLLLRSSDICLDMNGRHSVTFFRYAHVVQNELETG